MDDQKPQLANGERAERTEEEIFDLFMQPNNEHDDLGVYHGDTYLPFAGDARKDVLNWKIKSVGQRPKDYLVRDLLSGSLGRDKRLWPFRKMRKERPPWFYRDTRKWSFRDRKQIASCRILHFLHVQHLYAIAKVLGDNADAPISKLKRCWPYGIEVQWGGKGRRTARDVCEKGWQCPFCLARKAEELYSRILRGPLRGPGENFLLLGRIEANDSMLPAEQRVLPLHARWDTLRRLLGGFLQQEARDFGATGGILVFQVGPQQDTIPKWEAGEISWERITGFSYMASVLAGIPKPTRRLYNAVEGRANSTAVMTLEDTTLWPSWRVRVANRHGLRNLLVGCSSSHIAGGDRGALTVPPWFISSPQQWRDYFEASRNKRLYTAWGDWIGAIPAPIVTPTGCVITNRQRQLRHKGRVALSRKNHERHKEAAARREKSLEDNVDILRPLFGANGSAPGREKIQQTLAEAGRPVSERDARWLAAALKTHKEKH